MPRGSAVFRDDNRESAAGDTLALTRRAVEAAALAMAIKSDLANFGRWLACRPLNREGRRALPVLGRCEQAAADATDLPSVRRSTQGRLPGAPALRNQG